MAGKRRKPSPFAIFITVLVIMLICCIALFIYGSMTNGVPELRLPGQPVFALRAILCHG